MKTKIVLVMVFAMVASMLICANASYGQSSPTPAASGSPPDATLYTSYRIDSTHTSVGWDVCGSTPNTAGCYASGSLGPFGKVGALIEGNPKTDLSTNTVTRNIYVLDIASGSDLKGVDLYIYKKTDTVTPDFDEVSVTLSNTISLPLVGGTARASMAANNKFLFIGTNRSPEVVELDKHTLSIGQFDGFSPPINVTAVTADKYGYVTVTFGSFDPFKESGIIEFNPDGAPVGFGGGAEFMLNTTTAVLPNTLH